MVTLVNVKSDNSLYECKRSYHLPKDSKQVCEEMCSYSVLNFHTITDVINFRISCIRQYLITFLQSQGLATESFISFFDEVQVAFNGLIHDTLSIFSVVSEVIKENSPDFSSIQTREKNLYLHEYLKLL